MKALSEQTCLIDAPSIDAPAAALSAACGEAGEVDGHVYIRCRVGEC